MTSITSFDDWASIPELGLTPTSLPRPAQSATPADAPASPRPPEQSVDPATTSTIRQTLNAATVVGCVLSCIPTSPTRGDVTVGQCVFTADQRIDGFKKYILTMDSSIQGQNGSKPFFTACRVGVRGFLLPREIVKSIVLELLPADPPWTNEREI